MLERILNKSKKAIQKIKRPFIMAMAGLTLLGAVGCKSIDLGSEWKKIDSIQKTVERGGYESSKIAYKINKPEFSDERILSVPIVKTTLTEKIKEREIITEEMLAEYKRTKENYKLEGGLGGFGIGFGIGFSTSFLIYPNLSSGEASACILGTLMGFLGAMAGAEIGGKKEKITSTPTGNQKTTFVNSSIIREVVDTKTISDVPAETYVLIRSDGVKFQEAGDWGSSQKEITVFSKDGKARVKVLEDILEFEFDKQELIEQVKKWKEVREIKEPVRSKLLPEILKYITEQIYSIEIKTRDESSLHRKVTNDEKTLSVSGYRMPRGKIYSVLEDFINETINPDIKEARIRLIDESTHMPVENANLDIETEAPGKRDLGKQYFEGDILDWSINKIKDYITGKERIRYDDKGEAVFSVHILSTYKTESTHSKYAFAKFNLDFRDPKYLKQTIEMSQDPLKIKKVDK